MSANHGNPEDHGNLENHANPESRANPKHLLPPKAAYDLWADTYPPVAYNPLMRLEQSVVEPLLARIRARRALDVGTGSGRYLPILASTGASVVFGLDFSFAMLTRHPARFETVEEWKGEPFARICADACRLPFRRGAFDVINASLTVGDVADLAGWTRELARALVLGGHLVYSDFHPSWTEHGWRRTFHTADGRRHDVSFVSHAIEQHLAALDAAGLTIQAIREPRFAGQDDPAIRRFRKRWGNPPVVVVFHAIKEP